MSGPRLRAWQREALDAWDAAGRSGIIEAVTGAGKTTLGIAAAEAALNRGRGVLVVVPSVDLLNQWYSALSTGLPDRRIGRRGAGHGDTLAATDLLVSTVQSATRGSAARPSGAALIIADEVHRYGAAAFSEVLDVAFTERLGLTATPERADEGVAEYLLPYFGRVIEGCDYDRARAEGILAPVRVMLVGVGFAPDEQEEYSELDEIVQRERRALTTRYGCVTEPHGEFMRQVMALSGGGDDRGTWAARRYLKAFSRRRALLAECAGKASTVGRFGEVLADAGRTIVFTETKESARSTSEELLAGGVVAVPFTSDLRKTDRGRLLDQFKDGDVAALVAPRILDEGIDVPEADVGIIVAASRSRRQMIQRMGRIIRPKNDGRAASFVVLYTRGTSEDPAAGAHETFLAQLETVADEVVDVPADDAPSLLATWLAGVVDGQAGRAVSADTVPRPPMLAPPTPAPAPTASHPPAAQPAPIPVPDKRAPAEPTADPLVRLRSTLSSPAGLDVVLTCLSVLYDDEIEVMLGLLGVGRDRPMAVEELADETGRPLRVVMRMRDGAVERLGMCDVRAVLDASNVRISGAKKKEARNL